MRAHRKKQRVHETAADEEAQVSEGAGTALATQSTGAAPLFGRMVGSNNAKLFLGCVKNALEDPLPFSRFTDYPDMGVKQQRDMLFHCKQRVPSRYFVSLSIYSPLFFYIYRLLFSWHTRSSCLGTRPGTSCRRPVGKF